MPLCARAIGRLVPLLGRRVVAGLAAGQHSSQRHGRNGEQTARNPPGPAAGLRRITACAPHGNFTGLTTPDSVVAAAARRWAGPAVACPGVRYGLAVSAAKAGPSCRAAGRDRPGRFILMAAMPPPRPDEHRGQHLRAQPRRAQLVGHLPGEVHRDPAGRLPGRAGQAGRRGLRVRGGDQVQRDLVRGGLAAQLAQRGGALATCRGQGQHRGQQPVDGYGVPADHDGGADQPLRTERRRAWHGRAGGAAPGRGDLRILRGVRGAGPERGGRHAGVAGREHGQQDAGDHHHHQAARQQREHQAVAGQRGVQPPEPAAAPGCPPLPVVGLHVTGELPGVVRDLDVDRGKREVVPLRFAASVHAHLSVSGHVSSSMRPRVQLRHRPAGSSPAEPGPRRAEGRGAVFPTSDAGATKERRGSAERQAARSGGPGASEPASKVNFRRQKCATDLRVCQEGRLIDRVRRGSIATAEGVHAT